MLRKAERDLGVITLSIGVSVFQPGESVESFFERADRALYRAKHEGRNRVVYDDRTGHPSTANEQHQIEMVED